MSIRVQFKRGTKEALDKYVGRDGEIVIDKTSNRIRIFNGETVGGIEIPNSNDVENSGLNSMTIEDEEPQTIEAGSAVFYPSPNKITSSLNVNIASLQNDIWGYKSDKDYTVGTFVVYNSDIYQCIVANGPSSTVANPSNVVYWSQIPTLADLETLVVPTGTVLLYAGSTLPPGYLGCQGAVYNPVTYEKLYNRIGTTYGGTAESPLLPDFRNRYPIGAGTNAVGTYIAEQLPNISGVLTNGNAGYIYSASSSGAFHNPSNKAERSMGTGGSGAYATILFDATNSNSIYTDSGKVYPLSLALNFIIKT